MSDNPLIRKLFHFAFLLKRPMTLGVRVFARNDAGEILLVKHTYLKGWYLPGGGVETGETAEAAALKELDEETGFAPQTELKLISVHYNTAGSKRDHVLIYKCDGVKSLRAFTPNREISEIGFFAADSLPEDISKGSAKRIDEILNGVQTSHYW